jgi:4'-phosphopantetheinyl transferase
LNFERIEHELEHWMCSLSEWKTPLAVPPLRSGEAHIWQSSVGLSEGNLERLTQGLPLSERERALRMRSATARRGFVVARASLRALLGRYLGTSAELELRISPYGKPQLAGVHSVPIGFSLAHSGGIVLLAFAAVELGVDIERIRPVARAGRIASRVFPPATQSVLKSVSSAERWAAFFAAWTQREALVKAVGGGMLVTDDPLDFQWPLAAESRVFEEAAPPGGQARMWTIAHLPAPRSFAAALVAAGVIDRIRLLQLPAEQLVSSN